MATITQRSLPRGSNTRLSRNPAAAWRHLDLVLLGAVTAIALLGTVMVWSATRGPSAPYSNGFFSKQVMFVAIGLALLAVVSLVDYRIDGFRENYRLVTNILDPVAAPALELARLYSERWTIETAVDELKTHLRGSNVVLRSKLPELVRQDVFGLLLAHYGVRWVMHDAALSEGIEANELSFVHTLRVVSTAPHSGQGNIAPRRKSIPISSRLSSALKSREVTYQGSVKPRASEKS